LIPKRGSKLFVAFVTFCKPLRLDSKTGDSKLQKETKERKRASVLIPKPGSAEFEQEQTERTEALP
jgi:hypothetical protein